MAMENSKRDLTVRQIWLRILIFMFCFAVTVSVIAVLLFAYDPNQNSPGALGSACMDVISMITLLILILSIFFEKNRMGRTTKLCLALMLVTMWALFFDFLTWALDGSLAYGTATYIFTIASLCSGSILGGIFVFYLSSYLWDMYRINAFFSAKICLACDVVAFLLTFTLGVTQKAFVFVDGHYELGALYDAITVLPVLTLFYFTGYVIKHVKKIGVHDVVSVIVYIFMMIAGTLIEAQYGVGATYVSIMLADVFIFVMLQNKLIDEEKKNVAKWIRKSNTDEVTGFFNRHAYEVDMALLNKSDINDDFVYISMDVNGLKVVNDNLGHDAGDELIVGASSCMRLCFENYGKLYRIGGDEFVAMLTIPAGKISEVKERFEQITSEWQGEKNASLTISAGYVTLSEDKNRTLQDIAVLADKRMYESKRNYYQNKGVDRRGQRDAHVALCNMYSKILKINLSDDSYQIVNMDMSEQTQEKGFSENISEWLADFAKKEQVHPEDADEFLAKTDSKYIAEYLKNSNTVLRLFYRRKIGDEYKRAMMEIIPSSDYSDDDKKLFLYVKDVSE